MLDPFECLQKEYTPTAQVGRQMEVQWYSRIMLLINDAGLGPCRPWAQRCEGWSPDKGGRPQTRTNLSSGRSWYWSLTTCVGVCANNIVDLLETMTTPVGHPDCRTSARWPLWLGGMESPGSRSHPWPLWKHDRGKSWERRSKRTFVFDPVER